MSVMDQFMQITPRHQLALEVLREHKKRDYLGGIGWAALRDEDEPFSLEQIVVPLLERGLVEDLTRTELGVNAGKLFCRITPLGVYCLGVGYMLKEPRIITEASMKATARSEPPQLESTMQKRDDQKKEKTQPGQPQEPEDQNPEADEEEDDEEEEEEVEEEVKAK